MNQAVELLPLVMPTSEERPETDPKANVGDATKAPRMVCYLCRRRFATLEHLLRHEELSDLHRANLEKLDHTISSKRLELRQTVAKTRIALEALSTVEEKEELERKLEEAETTLGSLQENFERRICVSTSTHVDQTGVVHLHADQLDKLGKGDINKGTPKLVHLGNSGMRIWVGASTWKGNKRTNEDRFMLDLSLVTPDTDPPVHGVAVFDGHSGSTCADYTVDHIGNSISQCLAARDPTIPFQQRLEESVRQAFILTDEDFLQMASARDIPDGTTALMAIMWADSEEKLKILVAHAGDSRAILTRSGGMDCVRLTEDHKPSREDERQWIEKRGGIVIEINGTWRVFTPEIVVVGDKVLQWGLAVSRSLGDLPLKSPRMVINNHPEVRVHDLDPAIDRTVVLASDGVFDVQSDDMIASLLATQSPCNLIKPDACARRIVRRAYELLSDDNLTAVVVHIVPSEIEISDEIKSRKRPPTDEEPISRNAKKSRRTL